MLQLCGAERWKVGAAATESLSSVQLRQFQLPFLISKFASIALLAHVDA